METQHVSAAVQLRTVATVDDTSGATFHTKIPSREQGLGGAGR